MHPDLEGALTTLGISAKVPTLRAAAELSQQILGDSREFLQLEMPAADSPLDVVAVGSIARGEASNASDFDYLVIAHGLPEKAAETKRMLEAVERLRKEKLRLKRPGSTGMFGKVIPAAELTERIGLQEDTNLSHSRRMLLLEESVSLYQPAKHQKLIALILDRYLSDYDTPKRGVPRFLLNDVIRYWRTIAVDYQAKRWEQVEPDWGLRYLKLIISRKLTFAGTLASLFLCESASREYFCDQFEKPPLARLAQLHEHLESGLLPSLRCTFEIAEEFAARLQDEEFRKEAQAVGERRDIDPESRFGQMRDRARILQSELERIFFDSARLGDQSRKYLSF